MAAFLFVYSPLVSYAQDGTISTQSAEITEEEQEDYVLPYPGLLPDSPLYGLKTARDRLIGFLITNPAKKAAFDLLQADKRLQAGAMLIQNDKNNVKLAETTISKGENYFEEAILKTQEAEKQGLETGELKAKLPKAVRKHKEILMDLQKKVSKSEKNNITQLIKRIEKLERQIAAMMPQKK